MMNKFSCKVGKFIYTKSRISSLNFNVYYQMVARILNATI